jgi:hypothetical protein
VVIPYQHLGLVCFDSRSMDSINLAMAHPLSRRAQETFAVSHPFAPSLVVRLYFHLGGYRMDVDRRCLMPKHLTKRCSQPPAD